MWKRIALAVACGGVLLLALAARADTWDKKTTITFSQTVELPGVTLPAGTYVFKLVNLPATRNVVQVFNAEENEVLATILAISHEHAKPHDKTLIGFEERPAGAPPAIHEWFYPGALNGLEFVYPKVRAEELARATGEPVLAAELKPAETPAELEEALVVEVTRDNREIEVADYFEPEVAEAIAAPVPETPGTVAVLPETASPAPLIALAGVLSLGIAAAMKAIARHGA